MSSQNPSSLPGEYVIQDPHHDYAIELIQRMHQRYGWRAICFYTSPKGPHGRGHPELLSSDLVAVNYHVRDGGLPLFIKHLAEHHAIRAVIPFSEPVVLNATKIATALGLTWAQPDVVPLFRDKVAFKMHLAKVDPGIRLNQFRLVRSAEEALQATRTYAVDRFVLKPVDGGGNYGIGIFDSSVEPEVIKRFWKEENQSEMIWDEYVHGTEYQCNGQVDGSGNIQILDITRYIYRSANGRHNIRAANVHVRSSDPVFTSVADYTCRVIKASGLRRSPFHAEVKIDGKGPCLIECAARLVGIGDSYTINLIHQNKVDVFDLAAHGYASAEPYSGNHCDVEWARYDSKLIHRVMGCSTRWDRIYNLTGVAEVEALPEFVKWNIKPFVGQKLRPTIHLNEFPYAAVLQGQTSAVLEQVAAYIELTVQWNQHPPTLREWIRIGMDRLVRVIKRGLSRIMASRAPRLTSFG